MQAPTRRGWCGRAPCPRPGCRWRCSRGARCLTLAATRCAMVKLSLMAHRSLLWHLRGAEQRTLGHSMLGDSTLLSMQEARASPSTPRRPIPLGEAICSPSWTPTTMACSAEKSWRPWAEVARESQWPQESGASQSPACRPTLQPRRPMLPLRRPTLPLRRPTPPLRRPTLRLHREAISSPSWTPTKMACSVEKRWPWAEAAFGRPVRQES
mmetsp:Transcript_6412/g.15117  ORF Transcript_6412/g.15117 Transcript_6412/m.15117 type:complete len:211 (-) Transcript_6412:305-937(-)